MKITQENMGHVQEILDKYDVSGLNDLDQRLFEWREENRREFEVAVTRLVTFKFRVSASSVSEACRTAEREMDAIPNGPSPDHGSYRIHPVDDGGFNTATMAREVLDA